MRPSAGTRPRLPSSTSLGDDARIHRLGTETHRRHRRQLIPGETSQLDSRRRSPRHEIAQDAAGVIRALEPGGHHAQDRCDPTLSATYSTTAAVSRSDQWRSSSTSTHASSATAARVLVSLHRPQCRRAPARPYHRVGIAAGAGMNGIGDYGVIGDCHSMALVGRDGSIGGCSPAVPAPPPHASAPPAASASSTAPVVASTDSRSSPISNHSGSASSTNERGGTRRPSARSGPPSRVGPGLRHAVRERPLRSVLPRRRGAVRCRTAGRARRRRGSHGQHHHRGGSRPIAMRSSSTRNGRASAKPSIREMTLASTGSEPRHIDAIVDSSSLVRRRSSTRYAIGLEGRPDRPPQQPGVQHDRIRASSAGDDCRRGDLRDHARGRDPLQTRMAVGLPLGHPAERRCPDARGERAWSCAHDGTPTSSGAARSGSAGRPRAGRPSGPGPLRR